MARVVRDQAEFKGRAEVTSSGRGPEGSLADQYAADASRLGALGSALDKMADRQAAYEGVEAGTVAGLEGRPTITGRSSAYGANFEQAAVATYANRLDIKVRDAVATLMDAHAGDPAGLQAGLADLKARMLNEDVIEHPVPRAAFELQFDRLRVPALRSAARQAERQQHEAGTASAAEAVDAGVVSLRRQAYTLGLADDGLAATAEEEKKLGDIVNRNVDAGYISPATGAKLKRGIASERVGGHLQGAFSRLGSGDEQEDFIDTLRDDYRSGKGMAKDLAQPDFDRLISGLEREKRNADREATRAERARRAEVEKQGERLLADGKLDRQWLDDHMEELGVGAHRRFTRAITSGLPGVVDPQVYGDLMARADDDPGTVRRQALDAYQAGKIDRPGFDRVLRRTDRALKEEDDPRPWPKEIRSDMLRRLKPAEGQDPVQARRQLDAGFAFDEWLDANPNATAEQARDAADGLVERYRGAASKNERADLPVPRFAATPRERMNLQDIAVAAQRLRDAVAAGSISREEAAAEVDVLRRWKGVLERDPGKAPK